MSIEQTLSIIKPDATSRNITGQVNSMIEKSGLKIIPAENLDDAAKKIVEAIR